MPFPWKKKKKNRVTRISQIVADLQSPKRGASLVVETGFPTSLIDLFVKNRSRFTKPKSSAKKTFQPQVFDLAPPTPLPAAISVSSPPIPETSSSSEFTGVPAEAPSVAPLDTVKVSGDDDGVSGSGPEVEGVGECGCGLCSTSVLAVFLIMFVVVILIASVKKLTIGITMSAFALWFLENVGKRVVPCLRPCSDADMRTIKPLRQRVSNWVWFQNLRLKTEKDCDGSESEVAVVEGGNILESEFVAGDECSTNSLFIHEIEVLETKSDVGACCEETCFVVCPESLDCVNGDRELSCSEMLEVSNGKGLVDSSEFSQCVNKGSRRVWFKSMIVKKLVPKKLRTSKKEKRERKREESKAEEQGDVGKDGVENRNGSSRMKLVCKKVDGVDNGIICRQGSSIARVDEEVAVISEDNDNNNRMEGVENSGYAIILLVTALAGLVVGLFPALILTVTCCLMHAQLYKLLQRKENLRTCLHQMLYSKNISECSMKSSSPVHVHI